MPIVLAFRRLRPEDYSQPVLLTKTLSQKTKTPSKKKKMFLASEFFSCYIGSFCISFSDPVAYWLRNASFVGI
jgi:hypothetical protein